MILTTMIIPKMLCNEYVKHMKYVYDVKHMKYVYEQVKRMKYV
jgi:hypothetical protein